MIIYYTTNLLALLPGPAQLSSGRGPGIIYHASDVEGREKGKEDLIERRWIIDVPMFMYQLIIDSTCSGVLVGAHSSMFFFEQ